MYGILEGAMEAEHARDIETLSDERDRNRQAQPLKFPIGASYEYIFEGEGSRLVYFLKGAHFGLH